MHAYKEVMMREFDFKEASFKEADAFPSPEMYEMKVLSDDNDAERKMGFEVNEYIKENKRYAETFDESLWS